jgi:uncharacterized lipoprotein YajG
MRRILTAVACLFAVAGCAGPGLDIGYPEGRATPALLAAVPPRSIVVPAVTDRRANRVQIGSERESGTPIVTVRPVPDIVRDALVVELRKNGHEVVQGSGDALVVADVEEFWLDAVRRSSTTQYVGRVAIALVVADGRTGDRLLTRRYVGISRRTGDADSREAWREVMDTALARTIHDVATDPELAFIVRRMAR